MVKPTFCGSWCTSPRSGGGWRVCRGTDIVEDDELDDALPKAFSLFLSILLYDLSLDLSLLLDILSVFAPAGDDLRSSGSSSTSHVSKRILSANDVDSCCKEIIK